LHALRQLNDPAVRGRIDTAGHAVMEAIQRSAADSGVPSIVQGEPSMFQVVFNADGHAPKNFRDLANADTNRYAAFRQGLLEQGIHSNSSGLACFFVSTAHTEEDTRLTVAAVEHAMAAVA
jgi:glutamate-1-semialdehyde 2,1-aminomutase